MKNSVLFVGVAICLSMLPLRAQEVELRDSLEAARITAMRRMQRDVGEMLTSPEHIRATASPLGEGDALRWVQSLPGVATGADGTSAFYVRGGNSGGNLLTVDGIPVYGYSHVLGITAILPADVIGSASFAKGGFGGAQGNFTSSHVALRTVEPGSGSPRRIHATLNNFLTGAGISMPVGGTETDIKTPKTKCPMDEHESGKPGYFSDDAVNALWELQQEALKYLSGHRAQSNLFDMDAEAEDVPEGVQIAGGNVLRIAQ